MLSRSQKSQRRGGVYIAVLGASLVVSLLGLSAIIVQRIQNRQLTSSADIRQAQLNAETAIDLALLTIKQDANWRTSQSNGDWFTSRNIGVGACTVNVTDPVDSNLANNADDPIVILGIGYRGQAVQRAEVTVDPRHQPLSCLRSAVAAGDAIDLQSDTLRTNGLITANAVSASSSQVYGKLQAVSATGSTYNGTTTIVTSDKRPAMPTWSTVFDYYRSHGTQIDINSLPTSTGNIGRNVGVESAIGSEWANTSAYGLGTSAVSQSNNANHTTSGTYSLRVQNRTIWYAGAVQPIDGYVKSGQQYYVEAWVRQSSGAARWFYLTLYTKGSGSAQFDTGSNIQVNNNTWTKVSATLTAPTWSSNLEYAFVKIGSADNDTGNTVDFYTDDLIVRETTSGSFIYRQVLGPGVNPFGATNSEGIYWINCAGNKLVIERSRIRGTLLIVNPGTNSCVGPGPIHWTPAVAGYPALMVDADDASTADFSIQATNRMLSEKENGVNFNPTGASHEDFGTDTDTTDIYQSQIRGLVVVEDDLTFQNRALIRGSVIFGDDLGSSSGQLEVDYSPDALLNPPPGFWNSYSYVRRPASERKTVLP